MAKRRSFAYQVFVDELPAIDRELLWRKAAAVLQEELRTNEGRRASQQRRSEANLLSAAIALYGQMPRGDIRDLSERACRNANLGRIRCELGYWEPYRLTGPGAAMFNKSGLSGCVVAAFHFGDYRMLPAFLAAQGLEVDLLSDTENAKRFVSVLNAERVQKHLNTATAGSQATDLTSRLHSFDSANRSTTWQLLTSLRRGHVAVIFPDGNSGAETVGDHQGHAVVASLLGRKVLVKSGPAILAYAAGSCVIPVFPFVEQGQTCLRILDPLRPQEGESLQSFRDRVSIALFAQLTAEIERRPSEWEEWHSFFRWLLPTPNPTDGGEAATAWTDQNVVSVPGQVRLVLADHAVWRLKIGDEWHVVDVRAWQSFGTNEELGRLVLLAESGSMIEAWRSQVLDTAAAQDALSFLLGSGRLRLQ